MEYVIEVRNLKKCYKQGDELITAVDVNELNIEKEKITAIVGRSGSGKSTLLNLLGGMDKPTQGKVFIDKSNIYQRGFALPKFRVQNIGFVFQEYNLIPELTVLENIRLPLLIQNSTADSDHESCILDMLEIRDRLTFYPVQLSGGQKQRVAIARALITKPAVVLADEPTGSLDQLSGSQLLDYIKESNKQLKQTFVIATHDSEVSRRADKVITLEDGKVR